MKTLFEDIDTGIAKAKKAVAERQAQLTRKPIIDKGPIKSKTLMNVGKRFNKVKSNVQSQFKTAKNTISSKIGEKKLGAKMVGTSIKEIVGKVKNIRKGATSNKNKYPKTAADRIMDIKKARQAKKEGTYVKPKNLKPSKSKLNKIISNSKTLKGVADKVKSIRTLGKDITSEIKERSAENKVHKIASKQESLRNKEAKVREQQRKAQAKNEKQYNKAQKSDTKLANLVAREKYGNDKEKIKKSVQRQNVVSGQRNEQQKVNRDADLHKSHTDKMKKLKREYKVQGGDLRAHVRNIKAEKRKVNDIAIKNSARKLVKSGKMTKKQAKAYQEEHTAHANRRDELHDKHYGNPNMSTYIKKLNKLNKKRDSDSKTRKILKLQSKFPNHKEYHELAKLENHFREMRIKTED
jgi:hypothetical protein